MQLLTFCSAVSQMEEVSVKIDAIDLDKSATVLVDIESLQQPIDRSSGSPKIVRALSRKWSYRAERLASADEEDTNESTKKSTLLKVNSQLEPLKQSVLSNKSVTPNSANHIQGGSTINVSAEVCCDGGRNKHQFNRFLPLNPRKILCISATASSVGSLVLIYFTLAIYGTL